MGARELTASVLSRMGTALSVVAIIAASVVGLHSWADGEATSVTPDDSSQGITG